MADRRRQRLNNLRDKQEREMAEVKYVINNILFIEDVNVGNKS